MDKDIIAAFDDVHAEVLALNGLVVGLATALKKRDFPVEILHEAFDLAEMTAIAASDSQSIPSMRNRGTKMLEVLESLRKAVL